MKTPTFKRAERMFLRGAACNAGSRVARWIGGGFLLLSLLCAASLSAATVDTLGGGPVAGSSHSYGFRNGDTFLESQFNGPAGLALDPGNTNLFVADTTNNAVRKVDFVSGKTSTFVSNSVSRPVGVVLDGARNVYVLNRGSGNNGNILKFDRFGTLRATLASSLVNATAITIDPATNLYVTVAGNRITRVTPAGVTNTVVTIPDAGVSLQGITFIPGGLLAATDSGKHGIWLVDQVAHTSTKLTGFNGAGDQLGLSDVAKFNRPWGISAANGGILIVTDRGNHRVKMVYSDGTVDHFYGISQADWFPGEAYPGWWDGEACNDNSGECAEAREPAAVLVAQNGDVYSTELYYHIIRQTTDTGLPPPPPPPPATPVITIVTTGFGHVTLTWSSVGAASYNVKRSPSSGGPYTTIANVAGTTYTDSTVISGSTYYYVVSAVSASNVEGLDSAQVSATPPLPPVPDPRIGYVTFPFPNFLSQLNVGASFVFNNNVTIAIEGDPGSQVFYTSGPTGTVPNPTSTNGSTPPFYADNVGSVADLGALRFPDMTIKAIGTKNDGSPDSAVVSARFQFVTATPNILGNNAAQFYVSNVTVNAQMWYTVNGTDPDPVTNSLASVGPISSGAVLSLSLNNDFTFKIRAYRNNFQPSSIASTIFSSSNFIPNRISFGLTNNSEPHSQFLARPGQFFYAPVTLQLQPGGETMFSLQFNVAVTNGLTSPIVQPGAGLGFFSMLMTAVTPEKGDHFPPNSGQWYLTLQPYLMSDTTNTLGFSMFTNSNNNLLGVGWLFRQGYRYTVVSSNGVYLTEFDTTKQDLISFSIAHDTLFTKESGLVVVGAYSFQVPTDASIGDQYFIQLGSPSATRDGIGAPGSDVYIRTPAASQVVNVGTPSYIVGDAAPFHWLNAGDFGESNLNNADVMQVFQSGVLGDDMPPQNSDLYAAMDSSGRFGIFDPVNNYYVDNGPMSPAQELAMFDGSNPTINQVAFGDGILDITDVFVTFRRSLDPSLLWFKRFWTNGLFVAVTNVNLAFNSNNPSFVAPSGPEASPDTPSLTLNSKDVALSFAAGDGVAAAGQTILIPITAKILGDYPLRVLGLNLRVVPLDGSPELTQPVQFTPAGGLGQPTILDAPYPAKYAAAWLNNGIAGLFGNATIGTLIIKVPTNATANAAYAVSFDHASGSPNGLASFPKKTFKGLVTVADRSGSTYNDGIPDSWRLRWFGTVNNLLSQADADADGDGTSNLYEYMAGTDPNDVESVLRARTTGDAGAGECVVRWPTGINKKYVIEKSGTLYGPGWIPVSTNIGTGWEMEYHDPNVATGANFYRVRAVE